MDLVYFILFLFYFSLLFLFFIILDLNNITSYIIVIYITKYNKDVTSITGWSQYIIVTGYTII